MRLGFPIRGRVGLRLTRAGVWLVLLALALPGFALVGGVCCAAVSAKSADCCASPLHGAGNAMAGMGDAQMASQVPSQIPSTKASMRPVRVRRVSASPVSISQGIQVAATLQCSALPVEALPDFIVANGDSSDATPPHERVRVAASVPHPRSSMTFPEAPSRPSPAATIAGRLAFDPLFVSLRI